MSRAREVYRLERAIETEVKRIAKSGDPNKESMLRYYEHSIAEGLSHARIFKRLGTVRRLSSMLGKRFEEADKSDIVKLVAAIEQKNISQWTKHDYKVILKQFYTWLRGRDRSERPPEVKWIRASNNIHNNILKNDLLTPDDVDALIECADNIQEKAFFSVLFDSGRRVGEILGLRIGDVEFDSLGARLRVEGKVGPDIIRICSSQPRLATWLDNHPDRRNPQSPLWVVTRNGVIRQMPYDSIRYRLRKATERAGLQKPIWLYLFRHSRITPASTKLTYSQMCHVFGWKQGSDMPQFYVHLAGDERDEAFLKMNGMESNNACSDNTAYVPLICPRCKRNNSPDARYCNGCGLAFDLKYAVELDQRKEDIKEKIDRLSDVLARSPEIVDALLEAISLLTKSDDRHR
jgi:integrase